MLCKFELNMKFVISEPAPVFNAFIGDASNSTRQDIAAVRGVTRGLLKLVAFNPIVTPLAAVLHGVCRITQRFLPAIFIQFATLYQFK